MTLPVVTIAADGSCLGNPGVGAWSIVVDRDGSRSSRVGTFLKTTSNVAELTAVFEAAKEIRSEERGVILSDSRLVVEGCNSWRFGWRNKAWRKANGSPVANVGLWRELDAVLEMLGDRVSVRWLRGHAGHPLNEEADGLANMAARRLAADIR